MCAVVKITITFFIIFATAFLIQSNVCSTSRHFEVYVSPSGTYKLKVNNVTWLASGYTGFRGSGRSFTTLDGSLKLIATTTGNGSDKFGIWSYTNFTYLAGTYQIQASIKVYSDPDLPAAIFTQTYLDDVVNTSAGSAQDVISKFPSFRLKHASLDLGYLAYSGYMAGFTSMSMGRFPNTSNLKTGIEGGPLVLFDNSTNVIVISPLSQFMASSNSIDSLQQINWGIMGLVNTVPRGYTAMQAWGNYMTTLYQKSKLHRDNDPTIRYLGYWTDNGAFYYYNTEKSKNYETTIIDVVNYIHELDVPFQYLQFDSWWYPKGKHQGTKTWEPQSNIFPDGFRSLYNRTKLPFGCHNRFWDEDTTYAKYNGGPYNFIPDSTSGLSVPDDGKFWLDLFNMTQGWGQFILYEQDWLGTETEKNAVLLEDLFMARRWLLQMGQAAERYTITILYCMAGSRHMLQSLEIAAVTQVRASRDYQPGNHQWNIGITSIFADALNVAPFKDTFWTSELQPGNPYNKTEPNIRLQALIATLSTGPVGPGDEIGYINKSLLMKCCDTSGLILKPDKPAMAIDDQIKMAAFGSLYPGPDGHLYSAYSTISGFFFGIIFVADLKNFYILTPGNAWPTIEFPASLAFSANDPGTQLYFSNNSPIGFGMECTIKDFCLFYTSPLLKLSSSETFAIMGELDKWVPMSQQRVKGILQTATDSLIQITVQARETVTFSIYFSGENKVETIVCDNSKSSTPAPATVISVVNKKCTLA